MGAWWVAVIVLALLVFDADMVLFVLRAGATPTRVERLLSYVFPVCMLLAGTLSFALWLNAAHAAVRAARGVLRGFAYPRPRALMPAVYALACRQGILPVALLVAREFVPSLMLSLGGHMHPGVEMNTAADGMTLAMPGLWIVALLVCTPSQNIPLYLWAAALLLLGELNNLIVTMSFVFGSMPGWWPPAVGTLRSVEGVIAWVLGGAVVLALLVLALRRNWHLAHSLTGVMVLSALACAFGGSLGQGATFFGRMTDFLFNLPLGTHAVAGDSYVVGSFPWPVLSIPVAFRHPLPHWTIYPMPFVNLAWILLVFLAITALLGWIRAPQPESD